MTDRDHGNPGHPCTAVVVGLGKIGMGYDIHLPPQDFVLSHVRALLTHQDFRLLAVVDPDPQLRETFVTLTGLPAHVSIEDMLATQQPDVVVVASPTASHLGVLGAVLGRYRPRAILCEKPLAVTVAESQQMVAACRMSNVLLYVNYIRRSDPGVQAVRKRIADGCIEGPLKALVWYSKGMLHNASHFVDLMTYWLGPIRTGRIVAPGRRAGDNDAEADFLLEHERGNALFCAAWDECFSHYTVEIVAANGRLRYERGGEILWQGVETDAQIAGYRRLARAVQPIADDMNRYQLHVMTELAQALRGESNGLCSGEEALISQRWLERLYLERDSTKEFYG